MYHIVIGALIVLTRPLGDSTKPAIDSTVQQVTTLPKKYLSQLQKKSDHLEAEVNKRSAAAVDDMLKQEQKMQTKMMKIDTVAAKNILANDLQIPIYGINAMFPQSNIGKPTYINRANPNGTIDLKVGQTVGLGKHERTETFNIEADALRIWGRSGIPNF